MYVCMEVIATMKKDSYVIYIVCLFPKTMHIYIIVHVKPLIWAEKEKNNDNKKETE